MADAEGLPQQLVAQFRATSLERLERIESAWGALTQRMSTPDTERELFHDVHTLKGEARLVGFADVGLIAHRLEDLLFAARRRGFKVHEDVEVVVTMAVQFARMLVRKRAGASQGGIDLSGFLKHIDEVLAEWPRQSEIPDSSGTGTPLRVEGGRVSAAVRQRLGSAAAEVFLALLAAPSSLRLDRAWAILSKELGYLDAVALMPLVRRHVASTRDLGLELGKEVDVSVEGVDLRVGAEVLDAIHTALLHTLRNSVDHGIELPEVRLAKGKPRRGLITIRLESDADLVRVVVDDDGGGLDLEGIRRRAVVLGAMTDVRARAATEAELFELVFAPGFSVRSTASSVSGRGIGMDAVRATVERVKGTFTMGPRPGGAGGIRSVLAIPHTSKVIEVHKLPTARRDVVIAVPTTWTIRRGGAGPAVDPLLALGLGGDASTLPPGVIRESARFVLSRDRDEHAIVVAGAVSRATALRNCPTSNDEPLEIVEIDHAPAVLVRPESFFSGLPPR